MAEDMNQTPRVKLQTRSSGFNFEANRAKLDAQKEAQRIAAEQRAKEEQASQFPTSEPEGVKKSFQEKILSFTGGNILARAGGLALAQGGTKQTMDEIQAGEGEMQQKLITAISKARSEGRDTSRLTNALKQLTGGIENTGNSANDLYTEGITTKQGIGDAAQLAATAATGFKPASVGYQTGSLAIKGATSAKAANLASKLGVASNVVNKSTITGATGIVKGTLQGAKMGALEGAGFGTATGFAQGLKNDMSISDSLKQGAIGGASGLAVGGVLGGVIGGISGGISGYKMRNSIYKAQETNGLKSSLSETIKEKVSANPRYATFIKEARKQGFKDGDINFLATISKNDKPTFKKMYDLTVKAQSDPRQIVRAGDVLGENVTRQVEQVVKLNKQAGQAVDATAKALKGQAVDMSPLGNVVKNDLENMGISLLDDGTLDFSQSVFKNTPSVQKELQKVLLSIPDGTDAYQSHVFKKSLDEVLDYGTSGEGLKGQASRLLKNWRSTTDDILDASFDDYNIANSKYKETIDYISTAKAMVGKKVDLTSKEGAQAFGQALRSAFSNNKSRPNTLKFIEDTHEISKALGLEGAEKNLLDQALFVNMLEETFGTEAATGLAGEVSKALNTTMGIADAVRNPISGSLNLIAKGVEKAQNISPERKKQILRAFISLDDTVGAVSKKKLNSGKFKDFIDGVTETNIGLSTKSKLSPLTTEARKPITAYHGTPEKFDTFDLSKVGTSTDTGMFGKGFYFSDNMAEAKTYATRGGKTGEVKSVELDLKNPYIINSKADIPKIDVPKNTIDEIKNAPKTYSEEFTKYLQGKGYDGVIDNISANKQYVVFDPKQIKTIPKENPLLSEARKYKSAEEFVKAQPKVYHGGTADIKEVQLGKSNFQKTFYVSDKADYAKSFGGNKSVVNEMVLDSKAKLADMRKPSEELVSQIDQMTQGRTTGKTQNITKPDGTTLGIPEVVDRPDFGSFSQRQVIQGIRDGKAYFAELPEIKKALQKLGYDGQITAEVPNAKNIGVWNKDVIKTKSQLTDIWKKANSKSKKVGKALGAILTGGAAAYGSKKD